MPQSFPTDDFWKWVDAHRHDEPAKLRLQRRPTDPDWTLDAIAQIENERRSASKFRLPGFEQLVPRYMPVSLSVEQATSARVAQLHAALASHILTPAAHILDMTCGLGVDASFMAANKQVKLTAIDMNPQITAVATYNFTDRTNIEVINADSVEYLRNSNIIYDLLFIDPARRDSAGGRVYNLHDCQPDVIELMPLLTAHARHIMIKMSPMLDVVQTLRDLPLTHDLWVVGERGECRELLAIIDSNKQPGHQKINVWADGTQFSFTLAEEANAQARVEMPRPGMTLLEPSAALMKAGPFKLLCDRYDAAMIHPNTHLYLTDNKPIEFPGKVHHITNVMDYSSSNIKKIARQHLDADVAVRNFPISADSLRSKLGIKKSGNTRIVGITACDGKQYLLII